MEFVSGGYYILSLSQRTDYMDETVIPSTILSASDCITDFHPDVLYERSANYKKMYANKLKISMTTYDEMESEAHGMYNENLLDVPHVFTSVDSAKEFYNEFLSHLNNLKIIGLGLPEEFVNQFLFNQDITDIPEEDRYGIENILIRKPLIEENNSQFKGYEVLGYECGHFHSYLCNSLERDYKIHFNFTLNANGLIASLNEAVQYCNYTNDEDVGVEPVLWLPWAIHEYIM